MDIFLPLNMIKMVKIDHQALSNVKFLYLDIFFDIFDTKKLDDIYIMPFSLFCDDTTTTIYEHERRRHE